MLTKLIWYKPLELENLLQISITMTEERTVEQVMKKIVEGLSSHAGFALSRIWTVEPVKSSKSGQYQTDNKNKSQCLHLAASYGVCQKSGKGLCTVGDKVFSCVPFGQGEIGQIAETQKPVFIKDLSEVSHQTESKEWVERESVKSFAGHPLIFRNKVLGVIAIFCRLGIHDDAFRWLELFANQAAIAIANAQSFETINNLQSKLVEENTFLRSELFSIPRNGNIVGNSSKLQRMLEQISLVAPTEAAVLIQGESGTGKEMVANELHTQSRRSEKPLVKVNCAAIPHDLFESEFFGHVKGAFTGAIQDRIGRFQLADRGTLFLDEVGEIPLDLQSKLLRVLQEGEFERIGETHTRKVDVRIITATNRDLKREVERGRFREDLYYRLSVFPVVVPPLRDRLLDIAALVMHFAQLAAEKHKLPVPVISHSDIKELHSYHWPGNIRELMHVVERAVILAKEERAPWKDLVEQEKSKTIGSKNKQSDHQYHKVELITDRDQKKTIETERIRAALEKTGGKIYGPDGAAELLEIKPTTLSSRIKRWVI